MSIPTQNGTIHLSDNSVNRVRSNKYGVSCMDTTKLMLACIVVSLLFFAYGLLFLILKGKGSILIAGFNTKSIEEKSKYDELRLCADFRNKMFLISLVFFLGGIVTWIRGPFYFVLTVVLGIMLIVNGIHFNDKKAYKKYLK